MSLGRPLSPRMAGCRSGRCGAGSMGTWRGRATSATVMISATAEWTALHHVSEDRQLQVGPRRRRIVHVRLNAGESQPQTRARPAVAAAARRPLHPPAPARHCPATPGPMHARPGHRGATTTPRERAHPFVKYLPPRHASALDARRRTLMSRVGRGPSCRFPRDRAEKRVHPRFGRGGRSRELDIGNWEGWQLTSPAVVRHRRTCDAPRT